MAKKAAMFIATGSEPVEVLAPVDALRRGGVEVDIVSATGSAEVELNQGVRVVADILETAFDADAYDMVIVPGGDPGFLNLEKSTILADALKKFFVEGRHVASICAGPAVLARLGLLDGRKATCYPGIEANFPEGVYANVLGVVKDGNLITASGPGFAMPFGIACLQALEGEDVANDVASGMLMNAQ